LVLDLVSRGYELFAMKYPTEFYEAVGPRFGFKRLWAGSVTFLWVFLLIWSKWWFVALVCSFEKHERAQGIPRFLVNACYGLFTSWWLWCLTFETYGFEIFST